MKIIFSILVASFFSLSINSTNIPLKEIKDSIMSFLQVEPGMEFINSMKHAIDDNSFNNNIWEIKDNKPITDGMNGIFLINLSPHSFSYFLLVDDSGFQLINMRKSLLDDNLNILLDFLERNGNYNKEDVVFYTKELIRINRNNLKKREANKLYEDLVPTSSAALKIAEIILGIIYGCNNIENSNSIYLKDDIWFVDMSINVKGVLKNISVEINKERGEILRIIDLKRVE